MNCEREFHRDRVPTSSCDDSRAIAASTERPRRRTIPPTIRKTILWTITAIQHLCGEMKIQSLVLKNTTTSLHANNLDASVTNMLSINQKSLWEIPWQEVVLILENKINLIFKLLAPSPAPHTPPRSTCSSQRGKGVWKNYKQKN